MPPQLFRFGVSLPKVHGIVRTAWGTMPLFANETNTNESETAANVQLFPKTCKHFKKKLYICTIKTPSTRSTTTKAATIRTVAASFSHFFFFSFFSTFSKSSYTSFASTSAYRCVILMSVCPSIFETFSIFDPLLSIHVANV